MKKTVLITRPKQIAEKTAHLLQAQNYSPIILPLTQTVPLPLPEDPSAFNALIVTSTAVFMHAPEERKNIWRQLPLYCVGKTTALYAQNDGFKVAGIEASAQELTQRLQNQDNQFLYLAGHVRRPILSDGLGDKIVKIIEIYDTQKCIIDDQTLKTLPAYFDVVLFYSALAAQNSIHLSNHFDDKTLAICMAERIGDALPNTFKGQRIIAKEPTEEAIFDALFSSHSHQL